jgi:hypothetical protein
MHQQITKNNMIKAALVMLNARTDKLEAAPARMDPEVLELQAESS